MAQRSSYLEAARLMDEALLGLLQEKDLAFVTVKEVCARAGVSRSTFYLHYEGLPDLLDESLRLVLDHFQEGFGDSLADFRESASGLPKEDLLLVVPKYLVPYLEFVRDNKELFVALLANSGALKLDRVYARMLEHVISPILDRFGVSAKDQAFVTAFYMSGLMAVVEEWVRGGCHESPEHVAEIMRHCCNE